MDRELLAFLVTRDRAILSVKSGAFWPTSSTTLGVVIVFSRRAADRDGPGELRSRGLGGGRQPRRSAPAPPARGSVTTSARPTGCAGPTRPRPVHRRASYCTT